MQEGSQIVAVLDVTVNCWSKCMGSQGNCGGEMEEMTYKEYLPPVDVLFI